MDSRLFLKRLHEIPFKNLYLFRGDENRLMDKAWAELVQALTAVESRPVSGETLEAKDVSIQEVIGRVRTIPMFAPRRVLRVRDVDQWSKEQREVLEGYLAQPCAKSHVVFTVGAKKSWKGLEKAVEKHGLIVDFQAVPEAQLPAWVREKAAALGKTMTSAGAAALVNAVGTDLEALESEIEKLCLYVGEASAITEHDVEAASSRIRPEHVFKLMDHVAEGRADLALEALRYLVLKGDSPLGLLALLSRHLRLLWQVKDGLSRGWNTVTIAQKLHLSSYVVEKMARHAVHFSEDALMGLHASLVAMDLSLKTTGMASERVLETLTYKMCFLRR